MSACVKKSAGAKTRADKVPRRLRHLVFAAGAASAGLFVTEAVLWSVLQGVPTWWGPLRITAELLLFTVMLALVTQARR